MNVLKYFCILFFGVFAVECRAQWGSASRITMHRGQIAHTIFNPGMSGKKDNERKDVASSFSYPMGRALKTYSGGSIREGWNARSNTGGEGFWLLRKTDTNLRGIYAGPRTMSSAIVPLTHDMAATPEAYLGAVHSGEWALALRDANGREAAWTDGIALDNARQSYWPSASGVPGKVPTSREAAVMWNFRYGRYNTGQSFDDRIAEGEFTALNAPSWASALSEDDFPELVGVTRALEANGSGLAWERKWFQWGHTDYDDFLINETVVENVGNTKEVEVYVVFANRLMSGAAVAWRDGGAWTRAADWARDDHVRSTVASNYLMGESRHSFLAGGGKPAGLQLGKDLADAGHAMVYVHDGESDHVNNANADVGDPYRYDLALERFTQEQTWISEGHIQHGQYFGLGVVDAMPPFNTYGGADMEMYVAPSDNAATPQDESQQQPASVSMWAYRTQGDFDQPSPLIGSDSFIYDTVTQAGYMIEPENPGMYTQLMAFGPYKLGRGEKCKVVVAYVGGLAAALPKYDDYKKYAKPFGVAWMNLYNGSGQLTTFAERQQEIPLGEDVLFENFQNAINVYNWGYDIPNQPPNIKLGYKSNLMGKNEIYWSAFGEDATDPDYAGQEGKDLRGYRIYRSEVEYQGPWEFVTEVSFDDIRAGNLPANLRFDADYVFHTVPNGTHQNGIPLKANKFVSGLDVEAGDLLPGTYFFVDDRSAPQKPAWYSVRYYDSGHADWNGVGREIAVLESAPGPSGGAILGGRQGVSPSIPILFTDAKLAHIDSLFYPRLDASQTWTQKLILSNLSDYDLNISRISAENAAFQVIPTSMDILRGHSGDIEITFTGQGDRQVLDALTIDSSGGRYSIGLVSTSLPGVISTIAGRGNQTFEHFGAGIDAKDAKFNKTMGIVGDAAGNLYIAAGEYDMVFKMDANGQILNFAGNAGRPRFTGGTNYSADGIPAIESKLGDPYGLALDSQGNLYIADYGNHRVRKVNAEGIISTVAGNGSLGYDGDGGLAIEALLDRPYDVAIGPLGDIYVSVQNAVRKIGLDGVITTVAGKIRPNYFGVPLGDQGPATEAYIYPLGIFVDGADNLYIADKHNNRIRKVDKDGVISTIAGDGFVDEESMAGRFAGDGGFATLASLNGPQDIAMDGNGDLYILDGLNNRVRKVTQSGEISTVAGGGQSGAFETNYSGDGGAAQGAGIVIPKFLFIDGNGDILISTAENHIRKIQNVGVAPPPGGFRPSDVMVAPSPDFNRDGEVNFTDFLSFAAHYDTKMEDAEFDVAYDLDQNGQIGFSDFLIFASAYGSNN